MVVVFGLIMASLGFGLIVGLFGGAFRVANAHDWGYIVRFWPSFVMCAVPTVVLMFLIGGLMLLLH